MITVVCCSTQQTEISHPADQSPRLTIEWTAQL